MAFRRMSRHLVALLAGGLLALNVQGVSTAVASNTDKVMRVAIPFGPTNSKPDPRARQNGWLSNRAGVSETLIGLSYDMQMQPRLAEAYENLSPTSWKLSLRKGVKFHDGSMMDAYSVKASFEKLKQEGHSAHNPRLVKLLDLQAVEVVDDHTLIFKTNKPNSAFLWALTEPSAAVLKEGTDKMPIIGTGPFVFDFAETNKTYRTKGFADYWGGKPKLDGLILDAISDSSVATLALKSGDVDLVTNFSEQEFAAFKEKGGSQLFSNATTRLFFYQVRSNEGPLADVNIRKALSLALDRKLIVDATLAGVGGNPAKGIFPSSMASWNNPDLELKHDPEQAIALLEKAGFKDSDGDGIRELNGKDLVIRLRSYEGRAALRPTLEISQALLKQVGIKAEIAMGEYQANNDALKAGEIDMHLQAWGTAPQGDPDYFPSTLLHSKAGYNFSGYVNPELDDLLKQGREKFAYEDRKPIYDRIQTIINEDLPLIPLFHKTQVSVGNGRVGGYKIHPAETYFATPELELK